MNLITLNIDSIQLNQPLPFALRGFNGVLLAKKGYVIGSRTELETLVTRGAQLYVDTDESGDSHRAYVSQLQRKSRPRPRRCGPHLQTPPRWTGMNYSCLPRSC